MSNSPTSSATMASMQEESGRIAGGERIVEFEVPPLRLRREFMAEQEHRQDDIGLLDHLRSIDVQGMVEQQEGVSVCRRVLKIPWLSIEKAVVLGIDTGGSVERNVHLVSRPRPQSLLSPGSSPVFPMSACRMSGFSALRVATVSAAYRKFSRAIRFVYVLLLTTVLYSSGPVTPFMQNFPPFLGEKIPKLHHNRAVSTSISVPYSNRNSWSPVVLTYFATRT